VRGGEFEIRAPEPLAAHHELDSFECGIAALDEWLKRRAWRNEAEGASRTFVLCVGRRVIGYYSLAAGSVLHTIATGKARRNMPDPVPVVLLGRLAVAREWQRKGLAADLLSDAVLRVVRRGRNSWRARHPRACNLRGSQEILRKARFPRVLRRADDPDDYN
jgi:GNAT superfamily N-acetyltransferase